MHLLTWAGIFVTMILENFGIPFPTEASYILAAELFKRGTSYALLLSLLIGGHMTGCMLAYGLGRWGEDRLTRRWRDNPKFVKVSESIHGWYARYGNITIFATRFVGYVRPWSSMVAGFAGIRWQPFLLWTFIGTLIFNIAVLEFTIYFLHWWHRFGFLFRSISVGLFLMSFSVIFLIRHYWQKESEED